MTTPNTRDAVLRIKELPTLPSVLGRILATAADPDASALDLGQHIAADQSLSATLLRLVNSAYFGFYRQIKSVTQAIVMLGFLEVRNLALTATAFRALAKGSSDYDRMQLWRHSLAAATAAEQIARQLGVDKEGCFESGLLHDIGKVVFDMLYPEAFRDAAHAAHEEKKPITETEKRAFGMDHAEVGGLLGEHWNLPPTVAGAIRFHHDPATAEEPRLAHVAAVADYLTYAVGLGEFSNGCPPPVPAASVAYLKLSETHLKAIIEHLEAAKPKFEEFIGALGQGQ